MATSKTVLCCLVDYEGGVGGHKRSVTFLSKHSEDDIKELKKAFWEKFDDIILFQCETEPPDVFFQVKSDIWNGEFIDIDPHSDIPDKSVVQVVIENQVSNRLTL